jgi:hypothetical protein
MRRLTWLPVCGTNRPQYVLKFDATGWRTSDPTPNHSESPVEEGSIGRRVRVTPAFMEQTLDAVVALAQQLEGTDRRAALDPYLDPYSFCLMCLMRLLDVLRERG